MATPLMQLRDGSAGGSFSAGLEWEDCMGCQLLRPEAEPKALLHFLGGVFVSPQPQLAYRYLLESLAQRGYVVVATPYAVDFDYRKSAAEIHERFSICKAALANEYGNLPLLAMGHSLGALMQSLLGCIYAEYAEQCAGSALISWNNKPVSDAIPLFGEVFAPALTPLEPLTRLPAYSEALEQAKELRRTSFGLARGLNRQLDAPLSQLLGPTVAAAAASALRDAEAVAALGDQVPEVLASISRGASEFVPSPTEVRQLLHDDYTGNSTLVVSFSDDSLDESPVLYKALPTTAGARRLELPGTHLTPLAVDPDAPSSPLLPVPDPLGLGLRAALLAEVEDLVAKVDAHFTGVIAAKAARARETAAAAEAEAAAVAEGTAAAEQVELEEAEN